MVDTSSSSNDKNKFELMNDILVAKGYSEIDIQNFCDHKALKFKERSISNFMEIASNKRFTEADIIHYFKKTKHAKWIDLVSS